MFDSNSTQLGIAPGYQTQYLSITKAENGYTLQTNGATRVYGTLDDAIVDIKAYYAK